MDQALRHRILELETTYRSYDPATAINRLAVALAHAENQIKKLTAERDQARDAASAWAERASVLLSAQDRAIVVPKEPT
jgi:hypothetical protein